GASHPDTAAVLQNLAGVYTEQGKYAQALPLHQRALAIRETMLGASHPSVAAAASSLARVHAASGNTAEALAFSRKASAAIIAHAAAEELGAGQKREASGIVEENARYFHSHLAPLAIAVGKGVEPEPVLAREALEIAQWASQTSASAALRQMGTRFAA